MKILLVVAVCIVGISAVPAKRDVLAELRAVLDKKQVTELPDILPPVGIDGLRMLDWTVMDMLEEGCLRRAANQPGPPPPPTTEAPLETPPERQLLDALKRMLNGGGSPMPHHPKVKALRRALDEFCEALLNRDAPDSPETTEVPN